MPNIIVIDDRRDTRKTIVDSIDLVLTDLENDWNVIGIEPLPDLIDYPSWITEHDAAAIIIDERLTEVPVNDGEAVSYEGHELVDFIRERMNEFPIYVVTSYERDPEIQERFKAVEELIRRNDFSRGTANYVPRIIRAGQRYLTTFAQELSELSTYASKSAVGAETSEEERTRARAIQTKLSLAFSIDDISDKSEWLSKMDEMLNHLEQLKEKIQKYLEAQS